MIEYPNKLQNIFDKLQKSKIDPIIVGGYVRDYFLNIYFYKKSLFVKDIDIEIYNANSFEEIQNFLSGFGKSNIIGKSFGVIKLNIDNIEIDFSFPRTENKVSSGHKGFDVEVHPNIDFKTASSRRDFTINSMGYDVFEKKFLDPHGGLEDLKAKKLKVIDENSFIEDPLRVLRAMQFCARFEFKADPKLIDISKRMCQDGLLKELPKERIFEEFKKLFLKSSKPSIGLKFLKEIGAEIFFKELDISSKYWDSKLKFIDNVDKTLLDNDTNIIIMLSILCYKMDDYESFIDRLTNKKNILKKINSLYHVDAFLERLNKNDINNRLNYKIVTDLDLKMLQSYLKAKSTPKKTIDKMKKIRPLIHGKELVKIGIKPSKDYDLLLQLIYEMQIIKLFT